MEELGQFTDEQLQGALQQKATPDLIPEKGADLSKFSDQDLQGALQAHNQLQEQQLAPYRQQRAQETANGDGFSESPLAYLGRQFVSPLRAPIMNAIYGYSKGRLAKGEADEGDLRNIAGFEHEQAINQKQGTLTKLAGLATSVPGEVATLALNPYAAGAKIIGSSIAGKAAEEGKSPFDPEVMAKGGLNAAAQLGVLKAIGPIGDKLFPGASQSLVGRMGVQAATMPATQAAADAATYMVGLNTRYGAIQDFVEGKYGQGLQEIFGQALLGAGLAAAHGGNGKSVADKAREILNEEAKKGTPLPEAARKAVETISAQSDSQSTSNRPEASQGLPGGKDGVSETPSTGTLEQSKVSGVTLGKADENGRHPILNEKGEDIGGITALRKEGEPSQVLYSQDIPLSNDQKKSLLRDFKTQNPDVAASREVQRTTGARAGEKLVKGEVKEQLSTEDASALSKALGTKAKTEQGIRSELERKGMPKPAIDQLIEKAKPKADVSNPEEFSSALKELMGDKTPQAENVVTNEQGSPKELVGGGIENKLPEISKAHETLKETSLSPKEQKVIDARREGRSLADIGRELGVSKQRAKQIEQAALGKQGREESIAAVEHAQARAENAASLIEDGKYVDMMDMRVSHDEVRPVVQKKLAANEKKSKALDDLATRFLKEHEDGGLTEKRVRELAAEAERIHQGVAGRPVDKEPAPDQLPDQSAGQAPEQPPAARAADQSGSDVQPEADVRPQAMGAAAIGELVPQAKDVKPPGDTALANARIDKERTAEGLSPILNSARMQNADAWDAAMKRLEADPEAAKKLVESLDRKPRAADVVEQAMLLREKIRLDNEYRVLGKQLLKGDGDAIDVSALEARLEDLAHQRTDLATAVRRTGTELGRSLQFRRQLANEDFSLGGMLQEFRIAKGREATPEEVAKIAALQEKIAELQKAIDERPAQTEQDVRKTAGITKEEVEAEKAKSEFRRQLQSARDSNKGLGQKMSDFLVKLRQNFVISSPATMGKIVAASGERMAFGPVEEAIGGVLSKLPGLARVAAKAPREGFLSPKTEIRAAFDGLTKGLQDAWSNLKTGQSELDALYGKDKDTPREWLDLQFGLHAAAKAPAVRAEYTRSFLKRMDALSADGKDPTVPANLLRISGEAYRDSQAAKFQQENWLVDAYNKAINSLRSPDKPVAAQVTGLAMKLLTPVVRIPTNLAMEVGTYAFGTATGSAQLIRGFARGLENMKPAEADAIMRQFKKGALGAGLLAIGYLNPKSIGGYYSGKRDEQDVKAGSMRLFGADVPSWLLHNPALEVLQLGATIRRASDKVYKGSEQGTATGIGQGLAGWIEEFPLARETGEVAKAISPDAKERGRFFGETAKSFLIPQFFQWLAGRMDQVKGEPRQLGPKGSWDRFKSGVPGLRQTVPSKP